MPETPFQLVTCQIQQQLFFVKNKVLQRDTEKTAPIYFINHLPAESLLNCPIVWKNATNKSVMYSRSVFSVDLFASCVMRLII